MNARAAIISTFGVATLMLLVMAVRGQTLPFSLATACLVTCVFVGVCIAVTMRVNRLHPISFPACFLFATAYFTCSFPVVYFLDGDAVFRISMWRVTDLHAAAQGLIHVMLAFSSFGLGSMLVRGRRSSGAATRRHVSPRRLTMLKWTAYGLFAFSAAVILFFTARGSGLNVMFREGYGGFAEQVMRAGGYSVVFQKVALSYFIPFSLIILGVLAESPRDWRKTGVLAAIGLSVMMATGDRDAPVSILLLLPAAALLNGSVTQNRRKQLRGLVMVAVLFVGLTYLIPVLGKLRGTPIRDWSAQQVATSTESDFNDTPTAALGVGQDLLYDAAFTYQAVIGTVRIVPDIKPYRFGQDYLYILIGPVPFASTIGLDARTVLGATPQTWFTHYYNPSWTDVGLGYLQLAEAYLEFGAFGIFGLYFLLGLFLTYSWRLARSRRLDPQALAYLLMLVMGIYTWVRADVASKGRFIVWGGFFVYFVPWLLEQVVYRARGGSPRTPSTSSPQVTNE